MAIKLKVKSMAGMHEMTQKRLSELTGIRPDTLSNYYMNKAKHIPLEHIDKFCTLFKCTPGDLITYTDDSRDEKEQ